MYASTPSFAHSQFCAFTFEKTQIRKSEIRVRKINFMFINSSCQRNLPLFIASINCCFVNQKIITFFHLHIRTSAHLHIIFAPCPKIPSTLPRHPSPSVFIRMLNVLVICFFFPVLARVKKERKKFPALNSMPMEKSFPTISKNNAAAFFRM